MGRIREPSRLPTSGSSPRRAAGRGPAGHDLALPYRPRGTRPEPHGRPERGLEVAARSNAEFFIIAPGGLACFPKARNPLTKKIILGAVCRRRPRLASPHQGENGGEPGFTGLSKRIRRWCLRYLLGRHGLMIRCCHRRGENLRGSGRGRRLRKTRFDLACAGRDRGRRAGDGERQENQRSTSSAGASGRACFGTSSIPFPPPSQLSAAYHIAGCQGDTTDIMLRRRRGAVAATGGLSLARRPIRSSRARRDRGPEASKKDRVVRPAESKPATVPEGPGIWI